MKEKLLVQMLIQLYIQGISLYVSWLKSNQFGPYLFGILGFALSLNGMLSFFIDIGITTIHYQYTHKDDFSKYFGSYFTLKIVLIGSNYLTMFVWLVFQSGDSFTLRVIFLFFMNGLVSAIGEIFNTHLQVRMKLLKKELVIFSIQSTSNILQIYLVYTFTTVEQLAIDVSLVCLYTSIIQVIILVFISKNEDILVKPTRVQIREYFISAKPLIFQSVISAIGTNLGNVLLAYSIGFENLGYYNLVMTYVVNLFIQVSITFTKFFDTVFPKMFKDNDKNGIMEISRLFEKYASLFYILIIIAVNLFAEPLITILFPAYTESIIYMRFLIFVPYFDAINRPFLGNLVQNKKQKLASQIAIIQLITGLILQLLIVPTSIFSIPMAGLGVWGLISIRLFFEIENNLVFRYFSKRKFAITSKVKHLKHFFAGSGSFIIVYVISLYVWKIGTNEIITVILLFLLLISCYIGFLFVLSEITKQDLAFFREFFNFKRYFVALKEENQP